MWLPPLEPALEVVDLLTVHHLWRDVLLHADQEEYGPVDRTDAFAYGLAL
jgi:hypothetical protein